MDILRLLSDGQFHSGVQLAEVLGVSRTTISNRIAQWNTQGLEIDSVTGKGYRLHTPIQWLNKEQIWSKIPSSIQQCIYSFDVSQFVSSTNDVVSESLVKQNQSGIVCITEMQGAGRGRRGREWLSPPAGNFYGSIGWIFNDGFSVIEGLSLAVGVALIKAMESVGARGLQLKWPNDVLHQGKKLAGILIEMTGEVGGACQVVVGVGVNLQLPETIKQQITQPVTDLYGICDYAVDRQKITAAIVSELITLLNSYGKTGFSEWQNDWLSYDAFKNKPVLIMGMQEPLNGIARGVDEQGNLLLDVEGEMMKVYGGEVSLRQVLSN
ncbi:MAG: bifunctional biotin--[acetyl-CoA-carboxylase] ligase/biotin operon repressor BirA [Agitococcus sp.]|nr:bifunctional biotin--[acetyl-CoA-carboxylase] ligase/biotin operon repressor BirA [Agitococcus sp.]